MRIGVPREVKDHEHRVALTPVGVTELVHRGHEVFVQAGAGAGSFLSDDDYIAAGAKVLQTAADVWAEGELVLKVKEPIAAELPYLRSDLVLFTYLHLAANEELTRSLLAAGSTAIAYETVQTDNGGLPLLAPMSEIAGRLAPQVGAATLLRPAGGRGVLLSGAPGVPPANVVVLGGGVAGRNAAQIAAGLGSSVTVLDVKLDKLRAIDERFHGQIHTLASSRQTVATAVSGADLVIGAVLVPGAKAPTVVSHELVTTMKPGSVLVDISIDQGGCFADSRPTTHDEPTYPVHNSVFYCVTNMPGAVPRTATFALTNATLPYVLAIAEAGWRSATEHDPALARGVNTHAGLVTNHAVATAFDLPTR